MRLRFTVLASIVTALMALAIPGVGNAAPKHNRGLTINATPNPILAGEGVLIYGQLNNPPVCALLGWRALGSRTRGDKELPAPGA